MRIRVRYINITISILLCILVFKIADANTDSACPNHDEISRIFWDYEHYSWRPLAQFRAMYPRCSNGEISRLLIHNIGTLESLVGNHFSALAAFDIYADENSKSLQTQLTTAQAIAAVPYIANLAREHKIVITNERHHVSSDRLLPLHLLQPLYDLGYRYLALEALADWHEINERGYALTREGYYTDDVVFAELIRSARAIGFEIIAYEIQTEQSSDENNSELGEEWNIREVWQARNILRRTFAKDPAAKVMIHCGYEHIYETDSGTRTYMASTLIKLTGLDPLTVGQTNYSERSAPKYEHPLRREAIAKGLIGEEPVVLLDDQANRLINREGIDVSVFGIRTEYTHSRPSWMRMGGIREPFWLETAECTDRNCILEIRKQADEEYSVPLDRFEISQKKRIPVFLPIESNYELRFLDYDGSVFNQTSVSFEQLERIPD